MISVSNNNTAIDKFRNNVEIIKKRISSCTKEVSKAARDAGKAKTENDKKALLELASKKRKELESYILTLDDLTYAIVQEKPFYGQKIVSRFGYKTVEGYLQDKQKGEQPSLKEMMELISSGIHYIPGVYRYYWDENGVKRLNRNFEVVNAVNAYQRQNFTEPLFASGNPVIDTHDTKTVAGIVSSAARHR